MLLTNRAIWAIERNLGATLTLKSLASDCGVSLFHLAHAFGQATGRSLMQYVRERRLTFAAELLANGAPDIFEVALNSGYGSHEAFSRAFRKQFHMTPEAARCAGSVAGLALIKPLDMCEVGQPDLATVRWERASSMTLIGLTGRHQFSAPQNIPAQWRRFMELYPQVPAKADRIPIGVTLPLDKNGEFEYLCGAQVRPAAKTLAGLVRLDVLANNYAVFQHRDHVATLRGTYSAIWNHWLPAGGWMAARAPILERHNPAFDPATGQGGVEIWVPISQSAE
jgi:AraC family transcriptional regulator